MSTARSLVRGERGAIDFGFLGSPPSLASRIEMDAFALAHPEITVHYRELAFPGADTASWLAGVDRRRLPSAPGPRAGLGAPAAQGTPCRADPRGPSARAPPRAQRRGSPRRDLRRLRSLGRHRLGGLLEPRRPPRRPAGEDHGRQREQPAGGACRARPRTRDHRRPRGSRAVARQRPRGTLDDARARRRTEPDRAGRSRRPPQPARRLSCSTSRRTSPRTHARRVPSSRAPARPNLPGRPRGRAARRP